jgi:hypothetical protein
MSNHLPPASSVRVCSYAPVMYCFDSVPSVVPHPDMVMGAQPLNAGPRVAQQLTPCLP